MDSHVLRNDTKRWRSGVPFAQFFPQVMCCKTVSRLQNEDIDTDRVQIQNGLSL
jgi:hypothetical protein